MPPLHGIEAIHPAQLISSGKPYIEAGMARTKAPKDRPPAMPTIDQMISAVFPDPNSIDLSKAIELIETVPPPKGMSKDVWRTMLGEVAVAAAAGGAAARQADDQGSAVPIGAEDILIGAENILSFFANQPVAANAFKELRTKFRITQKEVADRAGVVRSAVAEWESGRVSLPPKAIQALLAIKTSRITIEPPLITGNELARLRKSLNITQAEMAAAIGTSSPSIGNWERFGARPLTREASAKIREHPECAAKLAELANAT